MGIDTETIWLEFSKKLHGFILSQVRDEPLADDLLQDVFIRIHLKKSSLQDESKLTSWLYQVTRNVINDHFRNSRKYREVSEHLPEDVEVTSFNSEFASCIEPLMDALPKNYRDAIRETELEGISQRRFAEKCGISYSGAKSRVQRGRRQLFELMSQCCKVSYDKYGNIFDFERGPDCKFC